MASHTSRRTQDVESLTGCDLKGVRVLVVGAGGIGCELVKNLVLSGFEHITMIDLDTIDYSNLNRQFLFRAADVNESKAKVAKKAVLAFPHAASLSIDAHLGNIKDTEQFGPDFFKTFNIVLNALDNVDARRHVNRLCLSVGIPLIESGTEGYVGQVRAIVKGKTKCFDVCARQVQKTFPICTIRNHPEKPELLFKKLFGGEETDLVLWEKRRPPVKVELAKLALPDAAATAREEQRAWSVEESAAVLLASVERIFTQRASEDDDDAMDFVAAAANLRCATFHIPLQSRWEIKGIAGRIIHAIATTNAVIAGFIVLEAFKVLRSVQAAGGDLSKASIDACRYCVCNRHLSGPKENQLLLRMRLEAPEPKCYVCTGSTSTLELDTASFTVRSLVVIKFLSFNKPTIDLTNELADKTVLLWEGEDEGGGEEGELHGDKPLDSLPVKLGPGVVLEVEDTTQALKCKIALTHTLLDKEEHPSGFRFIAAADEAAAGPPAPAEEDSPGGDGSRKRRKVAEGDAAVAGAEPSGGAGSGVVVADDDDDVIMLE
ncbi:hypothetical protein EMIHUDRAFT_452826 [Emiliania huxleyi CCMP1516]|uniref:THIF-type NAD/FAD binding fold domain-containing protein n=2 Tax=Emiliania huxleyi TaxID=2903 RepID=A0A0D3IEW2_EMIH1|nr:hypothetical protein EMIHUDRAFT_452826 [Emiliania huxleyi CCMP1516]EOD09797.1 hypothetical protein EMIHUDRAFT_452826 [Emiliania huxleyi CCMP1516]|eukprot:XP_005762226.1 hypothetical protein EMIHUDRAFT_452826 [Emiliania huxleyi CCMP1516]